VLRYVIPKLSWTKRFQKGNDFELISRYGLDAKNFLFMVRIGKRFFCLGGGEQGLKLITEVAEEELDKREVQIQDEEAKEQNS